MAGIDAFGTEWQIGDGGGPEVFTAVADVTNIGVLDAQAETLDVSSHDSAGQWREFVGGMKDAGELSMELNYDPAVHGTIFDLLGGPETNMKIVLPDAGAAEVDFAAIVTGFEAGAPFDDKLTASVTLKLSGAVVITP